jgi:Soluble lytic murein transglycosylase and related regulatory proteins (some contain LysM/invasin domains)
MVHFHSLRSFRQFDDDDSSGEDRQHVAVARTTDALSKEEVFPVAGMRPDQSLSQVERMASTSGSMPVSGMTPPFGLKLPSYKRTTVRQTDEQAALSTEQLSQMNSDQALQLGKQLVSQQALQLRQTGQLRPVALRIYDARSNTQSLVLALQSTMQPQTTGRAPLIIPAEKKRTRLSDEEAAQQVHLNPRIRHLLAGLAAFCILLFTMFSLTPLGSGQSGIPFFDSAARLVHVGQPSWSLAGQPWDSVAKKPASQQQTQTVAVAAPSDGLNLPQSQYIAIAQADAVQYGISPVYFVRQINQESGFNPYAYSPAGAVGIAQFEPATAAGLGVNPYNPVSALDGAARMMAGLSNQYGGNYAKALAAYNAGSGAVDNAVAAGGGNWLALLPAETQNYVAIIMG